MMKTRILLLAVIIAGFSGCINSREPAERSSRDGRRENSQKQAAQQQAAQQQAASQTAPPAADHVEHVASPAAEPAAADQVQAGPTESESDEAGSKPEESIGLIAGDPADELKEKEADEKPGATPDGWDDAGVGPEKPEDEIGKVELVISCVLDATKTSGTSPPSPTVAEGGQRGFCTVAIHASGSRDEQQALLYSYFTPDTPEPLKKLAPNLLESRFESTKLGTFSGKRGAVSGMRKFSEALPEQVVLCLPQGSKVRGDVGVRAQFWRFSNGQWKPHDAVLERTITLK